jgi:hypothetical protein
VGRRQTSRLPASIRRRLVLDPSGKVLVGRALTAQWLPGRPVVHRVIEAQGKVDGRIGGQNAWPVDMLQPDDVYVCDHFGLKDDGPSISDSVGTRFMRKAAAGSCTTAPCATSTV